MSFTLVGNRPRGTWLAERDEDGRTYKVEWLAVTNSPYTDGPALAMQCPGLPTIGSLWIFNADIDVWAFCHPDCKVRPWWGSSGDGGGEVPNHYLIEQTFSTKSLHRCYNTQVTDPLLEPMKVGGSFIKYTQEVIQNKDGSFVLNSAQELLHGPGVEFDFNRPQVWIEQNVQNLALPLVASMIDTVNTAPLWGLPARCIKLSDCTWERKIFGICSYYFTRRLVFDVDYNTFDRYLLDEGTKVLRGRWVQTAGGSTPGTTDDDTWAWQIDSTADPNNPMDYIRFKDVRQELATVVLDGAGHPAGSAIFNVVGTGGNPPGRIFVQYYSESDFTQLGIPLNFVT